MFKSCLRFAECAAVFMESNNLINISALRNVSGKIKMVIHVQTLAAWSSKRQETNSVGDHCGGKI